MARTPDYVVRSGDDGWVVIRDGDRRPSAQTETQDEAIKQAKVLSRREGASMRVLNTSGKIVSTPTTRSRGSRARPSRSARSVAS